MKTFNFGAGPAMLPEELLKRAQPDLLNWQQTGMSILEIGHRTQPFVALMEEARVTLKTLLKVPDNYQILFLGLPARAHFGLIPLHFLNEGDNAAYYITGSWSSMAFKEAVLLKDAYEVKGNDIALWKKEPNTRYIYYTPNETINGIRVAEPPLAFDCPIIADMTSCLLTEPINIKDYALIFAGAQKNIANAGLSIVIVRDDWLENIQNRLPTALDYRTHAAHHSLYTTPPTFNCYMANAMFQWIVKQGGVEALYEQNIQKAKLFYDYIDASSLFHCDIAPQRRSLVNVCFTTGLPELDTTFVNEATQQGLLALKGHKSVGGLRASLYNAMPIEGVEALIQFMDSFAKSNHPCR